MVAKVNVTVAIIASVSLIPQEVHASIASIDVKPPFRKERQLEEEYVPALYPLFRIVPRLLPEN